jgi:hypothetical protein
MEPRCIGSCCQIQDILYGSPKLPASPPTGAKKIATLQGSTPKFMVDVGIGLGETRRGGLRPQVLDKKTVHLQWTATYKSEPLFLVQYFGRNSPFEQPPNDQSRTGSHHLTKPGALAFLVCMGINKNGKYRTRANNIKGITKRCLRQDILYLVSF